MCLASENVFLSYIFTQKDHNSVENGRTRKTFTLVLKTKYKKGILKYQVNTRFPSFLFGLRKYHIRGQKKEKKVGVCRKVGYAAFDSTNASGNDLRNVYKVCLQGNNGVQNVLATGIPAICASICRPAVPPEVLDSSGDDVNLVDVEEGPVNLDLLVGLDTYWKYMTPELVKLSGGLVAQCTVLAWVSSGPLLKDSGDSSGMSVSHQLFCLNYVSESSHQRLWDLDSVSVCAKESSVQDPVFRQIQEKVLYSQGRYDVALSWKSESGPNCLTTRKQAQIRLRKLANDTELEFRYHEVIQDMQKGHCRGSSF